MPRLLALFSLLFVLGTALSPAHAEKPRIAVLELQGKAEPDLMAMLSDKVRLGVLDATRGQDIVVMSRENMAVLAKDMGLDLSCIEGACEVETGRNIGAKYVVSGSVTQVDGLWLCTLKVHETESGALLSTGEAEASGVLALRKSIPPEMTRLMGVALSGSSTAVAAPAPVVAAPEVSDVQTVTGGGTDIAALAARAAQAKAARESKEAAFAAEQARIVAEQKAAQARLDAQRKQIEEEERKARAALEAAQRKRLDAAAQALQTEAAREYAALKPLVQMDLTPETRPVLQAFVSKYSGAKVTVDDLEQVVVVPGLSKVKSKLNYYAMGPQQWISITANPADLTLGQDSGATLNMRLSGGANQDLEDVELVVQASSGTVSNVTHLGGGNFSALYQPSKKFFPHLALITVADKRAPGRTYGSIAIPLIGKANFPVIGQPNGTVLVRIDDREYGPVATDSAGRAQVPLEVHPGFGAATVISVVDGRKTEEPLDLQTPAHRRVLLFPMEATLNAATGLKVPIRAYVVRESGEPDPKAKVTFHSSMGTVSTAKYEGRGVYRAELLLIPNSGIDEGEPKVQIKATLRTGKDGPQGAASPWIIIKRTQP